MTKFKDILFDFDSDEQYFMGFEAAYILTHACVSSQGW